MKSGITGHRVTTSKRQLPSPNMTRLHLALVVHPSHIREKVDTNQTERNKISDCKLAWGFEAKKILKDWCKTRAGCKGKPMNSNDHSFFTEQSFVYTEAILLSHTFNLSFLYTVLSVFT